MANYQDTLDELFLEKLNYEYVGIELPVPAIVNDDNILSYRKEYTGNDLDIIVVECKDRITEFQKKLINHQKEHFPNAHFLFISNEGKVYDLYNNATSKKLKRLTYDEIGRNTRLFKEKLQFFDINLAEGTTDLQIKAQQAFDVNDKITKKFFDNFKKLHEKLQSGITGIADEADVRWYASVLLNRIMFIYFLQKHKVLQDDEKYLLTKFDTVNSNNEDYYKDFLLPLFFLGFAKRDSDVKKIPFISKYGNVRYLNGGLFYPHHIEKKYAPKKIEIIDNVQVEVIDEIDYLIPNINVDAKILHEILTFLNGYTWYLDNRPMKDEKDINPDVLGYIFEKYINQKELGAYYTKEDITDYISKNTIIPFICNKLIANNYPAPEPTVHITNNTLGNAKDNILTKFIEECHDYETLKFIYKDILLPISVLDPSVGSGAFLFAGLNILLPIYQKTVFNLKMHIGKNNDKWLVKLCNTLSKHSEEYFLTKQIILNNLYGVDIVEEATEICKLRLFLQLASHLPDIQAIEPLPDIDFNIYAGNSLVGGLSWKDLEGNYAMNLFVDKLQLQEDVDNLAELKQEYRELQQNDDETKLSETKEQIIKLENRINANIQISTKTKPFHWFVEYKNIIDNGGFDVIIGNPPYLEFNQVEYDLSWYKTSKSAVHGVFIEKSSRLLNSNGCMSMILPLSLVSTQRMKVVREFLEEKNVWYSNFSWRPGKLFEQVNRGLTIFILNNSDSSKIYSTGYIKWDSIDRPKVIENIKYTEITEFKNLNYSPKLQNNIEINLLKKILKIDKKIIHLIQGSGSPIFYKSTGGLYWKVFTDFSPKYSLNGIDGISSRQVALYVNEKNLYVLIALLSSDYYWWWYTISSNLRDNNPNDILNFPLPNNIETDIELSELGKEYLNDIKKNSIIRIREQKNKGTTTSQSFVIKRSKKIIEKINKAANKYFEFTNEELDFINNYDIEFRINNDEE